MITTKIMVKQIFIIMNFNFTINQNQNKQKQLVFPTHIIVILVHQRQSKEAEKQLAKILIALHIHFLIRLFCLLGSSKNHPKCSHWNFKEIIHQLSAMSKLIVEPNYIGKIIGRIMKIINMFEDLFLQEPLGKNITFFLICDFFIIHFLIL